MVFDCSKNSSHKLCILPGGTSASTPLSTHCSNTGQLGSLKVHFLKQSFSCSFPSTPWCPQGMDARSAPIASNLHFFLLCKRQEGQSPDALSGRLCHWPPSFNQTRAAHHKKLILSLTKKSQPIWWESNRKCEIRGLFIYSLLMANFDHRWGIPTVTGISHCS